MIMVTFPLGEIAGTAMSLQEATSLAERSAELIHQDDPLTRETFLEFSRLLEGHGFLGAAKVKAAEQLMTGFGIAYPDRINPQKVLNALDSLSSSDGKWGTRSVIDWGSSTLQPISKTSLQKPSPQVIDWEQRRLRAREIHAARKDAGFSDHEVVAMATEMISIALEEGGSGVQPVKPPIHTMDPARVRLAAKWYYAELNAAGYSDRDVIVLTTEMIYEAIDHLT